MVRRIGTFIIEDTFRKPPSLDRIFQGALNCFSTILNPLILIMFVVVIITYTQVVVMSNIPNFNCVDIFQSNLIICLK